MKEEKSFKGFSILALREPDKLRIFVNYGLKTPEYECISNFSRINYCCHFSAYARGLLIPFINKGMDFIDLPSIFRDKSVQSSIPNYFKNCEVPIICYKYNKPIRGAIFNFNKLVSDLNIETCTPDS